MRERPILFSSPMVRAILDGGKTQTRRVVKPNSDILTGDVLYRPDMAIGREGDAGFVARWSGSSYGPLRCPYGAPGERLWCKETWVPLVGEDRGDGTPNVVYRAHAFDSSSDRAGVDRDGSPREVPLWKPSIFMARWASRITLEITEVRVQRLQEISREDCIAEGLPRTVGYDVDGGPEHWFKTLWQTINGAESWAANPWVWCVSFRRIEKQAVRRA